MYERFFGLADAPFRLTPDPRYLFLSKKHAEALAHLKLGLRESTGFVCITGDVGTGKTTLLRSFLRELGPEIATAYVFNPPLTALELLKTINGELGLHIATRSRKRLVDALNAHLLAERQAGRRAIVVIDEAQALPIDVLEQLRLLSNLETTTEKLLRIVLVGQPQLRALLLHPELVQLNQRITLRWHMGPLSPRETAAYVEHRLTVAAGGPPPRIFTRAAVRRIHHIAGGVPRLVNMVAHRAMLAAFAADRHVVSARFVRKAYREIGALPLAASAPRPRPFRWTAGVAAAAVAILALGATRLGWLPDVPPPATHQDGGAVAATPPPAEPTPPAVAEVDPPAPQPDAAPPDAAPPVETASTEKATAEAPRAADAPPATPDAAPDADLEARLAAADAATSARLAVNSVFGAWRVAPLAAGESGLPPYLTIAANARKLDHLPFVGNGSMLRLLDLPAVLELRLPGTDGPRYAALTGVRDGRMVLAVAGVPTPVDPGFLERHWFGEAHVFWRDFEGLGPTFGREGHGAPVARLQALLRNVGAYRGAVTGVFDAPTEAAVLDFQRARLLVPDGRVGKLTRIVLYAAAGGYARPTLGTSS
jgi:general secretion pathway protein A